MPHNNKIYFLVVYFIAFLITYHSALPLYINSSFLGTFLPESAIGFVYALSAALVILLLIIFPKILARFGNYKTILALILLEAGSLILLSLQFPALISIAVFIFIQVWLALLGFNLDIFLERFSDNKTTGRVRGLFLATMSFAVLLGPLSTSFILSNGDYQKIYLISALFLIPVFFIIAQRLRGFQDPQYRIIPYAAILKGVFLARHPKDEVRHATFAGLLLRFFYSWMVIYTPLYLNIYMGFTWSEIGIILTIMLIPFVLFEAPIGRLADTSFGEKKIMMIGFCIMAFFTGTLFFITNASILLWAALLFGTRVGASFVEVASESYFFKHIESKDTEVLSVFRNSQLLASIVAPFFASLLLLFTDMKYLFPALALIMLLGIWVSGNTRPARNNENK